MQLDGPRRAPESGRAARQLLVLTHGLGASGAELIEFAGPLARALPDAAFVAPDGPEPYDDGPYGRQWFSMRDRRPSALLAGVSAAAAPFNAFVDAELGRLGLQPEACALLGFSQGAMMVLHAGLRRSAPPRLILAYAGALLAMRDLSGTRPAPVLLVHGEADGVVAPELSRVAERILRDAGLPVEAAYLPGLGHAIDERALQIGVLRLQQAFADRA